MKLYSTNEQVKPSFLQEKFVEYYLSSVIISQEALSDYLYKIKDTFSTIYTKLTFKLDKPVIDISTNKFETLHKIKRLKFRNIKDHMTSKPENFRGKYTDYTIDLINSSNIIYNDVESTLNNLKLALASFINEYSENKIYTLYGSVYFNKSAKLIEAHTKEISKYFPIANGSTKDTIGNLLKTLNDIEALYKNIEILDNILNLTKINYIAKLTNEVADLIDALIEHNIKTNILNKNNEIKKELISAIHITAKEVEFLNYLYSNAIIFYGSFKNLTDDLNKLADIE